MYEWQWNPRSRGDGKFSLTLGQARLLLGEERFTTKRKTAERLRDMGIIELYTTKYRPNGYWWYPGRYYPDALEMIHKESMYG